MLQILARVGVLREMPLEAKGRCVLFLLWLNKDSSACHLDISPWATDPVFRDLTKEQRERLLLGESDFLEWQIAKSSIETVVFNGAQVYESLNSLEGFRLQSFGEISYQSGEQKRTSQLYIGHGPGFTRVYGWSLNLQELRVSKEEKTRVISELSDWLKGQQ